MNLINERIHRIESQVKDAEIQINAAIKEFEQVTVQKENYDSLGTLKLNLGLAVIRLRKLYLQTKAMMESAKKA
jgi:hypothetical protein